MRKLIIQIIANITAFFIAARLFPAIKLDTPDIIIWAGLILALLNLILRPPLFMLTLPINFITLGLFTLILNTWMVMLTDTLLPGMRIPAFWLSFAVALIISGLNTVLHPLYKENYSA
ncbi:MAG: phage holin family protein [Bacillota bacterium]